MSRYEGRDWSARRRRNEGQTFRANAAWILMSILVAATAALLVVGQKVRFNGVTLATDAARAMNDKLQSDWHAHQLRHQRQATRAQLLPLAASLGFTETTTEAFRLVAFDAGADPAEPGLIDRIVAPALAGEANPASSRRDRRSTGATSGR
jgi:hypothetical protein